MKEDQSIQQVLPKYRKILWNTDQPKDVEERGLRRASFLTIWNYQVLGQICKSYTSYFRSNSDYSVGKLDNSPTNFAQNTSYDNLVHANKNPICLNTAIFSNSNLLILPLILLLVHRSDYIQNPIFHTLIDSRSMHCFLILHLY